MKFTQLLFIVLLGLFGCGESEIKDNGPNMNLVKEYDVDSRNLIYQYYQKFGFTDICENIVMVAQQSNSPSLKKELPISAEDLKIINEFSNKNNKINGKVIFFKNNFREVYKDIELDFVEFSSDEISAIKLNVGEYEIFQTNNFSLFKVYDSISGILYIEVHKCDGE